MIGLSCRGLATLVLLMLVALLAAPASALAAPRATPEPIFGAATAEAEDEGVMTPTGNGRFSVAERVYVGKSLGRSVAGEAAVCFTGELRAVDEWALESPRLIGTHESAVTIRSERGTLGLRLRGQMEYPSASGTWEVVRASGGCAGLRGDGRYTATFATARDRATLRVTFDGEAQS